MYVLKSPFHCLVCIQVAMVYGLLCACNKKMMLYVDAFFIFRSQNSYSKANQYPGFVDEELVQDMQELCVSV